jgi:hypothetical protein
MNSCASPHEDYTLTMPLQGGSTPLILILCDLISCTHMYFHAFVVLYGPGVDSASNRNEHQEYFLGVKEAGA